MKTFFAVAATFLCSFAFAQKNASYNQSIDDNGKRLSIKIKGDIDGKTVEYNRVFDVTGWTKEQKEELKDRIYDSLGIKPPVPPVEPMAPTEPLSVTLTAPRAIAAPSAPLPPAAPVAVGEPVPAIEPAPTVEPVPPVPPAPVVAVTSRYEESYAIGGDHPYTKEIKYNPKSGILYMKYRFTKNGEETTYEKSLDAKDKSKEERSQLIKKYEKEIGLLKTEKL